MPSRHGIFQFSIFLSVALSPSGVRSPESLLRRFAALFPCCLSIRIFCYDLSVPIFCSKIFYPLPHPVVGMASPILPLIVGRIIFRCFRKSCFLRIVWSCLSIFLVFFLELVFFCWSPQVLFFVLVAVLFQFRLNILNVPFEYFACCRSLFICDSSLISHPGFDFLSVVFKGTPIFSKISYVLEDIKSFNCFMSLIGIVINKSFTFSVLDLTLLQSWFLKEGNIFFSDMILLMVSTFVFSS